MKFIKKIIWLGILVFIGAILYRNYQANLLEGPTAPTPSSWVDTEVLIETPESMNIEIPFFTQAPHSNWDYPWQEACEEASVLLVANDYQDLQLDADGFNEGLLALVDWEMDTYGAYEHTTVQQTLEMMNENYGLEGVIHDNPSFESIQDIISNGNLIIAPFAGKYLGNPNFRNGGPTYHMLVIKGYDAEKMQVVTHDVGTRNGEDYVYSWETINLALHDWHDDDILEGTPRFIEVIRP